MGAFVGVDQSSQGALVVPHDLEVRALTRRRPWSGEGDLVLSDSAVASSQLRIDQPLIGLQLLVADEQDTRHNATASNASSIPATWLSQCWKSM